MSAANPLITPVTTTATATFNATEYDQIVVCTNTNLLGAGETVTVNVLNTLGASIPYVSPFTGSAVTLATGGTPSANLPGGFLYSFTKSVTASAIGLDVLVKPRAMTGA